MIAEVQFGTELLRPTLRDTPAEQVSIEQLDAPESVPLRMACWFSKGQTEELETALSQDWTVEDATCLFRTDCGNQYHLTCDEIQPDLRVYEAVIEQQGVFLTGYVDASTWQLQIRFPDKASVAKFRDTCQDLGIDITIETVEQTEPAPHAVRYDLSEPQREILLLASRQGYFEVPRESSLSDLSEDIGVSSQAASERLRRGLDSLVSETIIPAE